MGEWGKIGVGYKMGSTAYGIEAVLGGVGYLFICSVLYKCSLHSCSVVWCICTVIVDM